MDETTPTDSHHPESALRITLAVGHSMGRNVSNERHVWVRVCYVASVVSNELHVWVHVCYVASVVSDSLQPYEL